MPRRYVIIHKKEVDFLMGTIKYEVQITGVGKDAQRFLDSNSSFILMDENIHPNLRDMVVAHTVGTLEGEIKVGDKLQVGNSDFTVTKVGDNVNRDLANGGHCTIVINKEGTMPGQVSVKGKIMPRLRLNNIVAFYSEGDE